MEKFKKRLKMYLQNIPMNKEIFIIMLITVVLFFMEIIFLPNDFMLSPGIGIFLMLIVMVLMLAIGVLLVFAGIMRKTNFRLNIKLIFVGLIMIALILLFLFSIGYPDSSITRFLTKMLETLISFNWLSKL